MKLPFGYELIFRKQEPPREVYFDLHGYLQSMRDSGEVVTMNGISDVFKEVLGKKPSKI